MTAPEDYDPDPWWRDDHLNDGLGPYGLGHGRVEDDMAPTRAEAEAEDRLERARRGD